MMPSPRLALFFAPAADSALWRAGSAWLGRDAETGAACMQPDLPGIAAVTAEPRRYGFHATLKPPFRLAAGVTMEAAMTAIEALAGAIAPFTLPRLAVAELGAFLALRETAPCPRLQALADLAMAWPDALRAPPDAAETARRLRAGLTPVEARMLERWGYPYAFGTWSFHMTLTGPLAEPDRRSWRRAAENFLAPALAEAPELRDIAVFVESAPGAPLRLTRRVRLGR